MNGGAEHRSSLAWGFRSLGEWRLIFLLAATTVLLALPSAAALWPALHSVFGQTLAGDHVLRNHPLFAPADALEFLYEKRDVISAAWRAALGGAVLALLIQVFFAGGFVEVLVRRDRARLAPFFAGAAANFGHNLKCFAIFAVSAAVVLGVWIGAAEAAAGRIFEGYPPGSLAPRFARLGTVLVAFLFFAVLSLLHDFARIARRVDPGIGAWRGFAAARRTLSGGWLRAFGLLLFWLLAGGGAWLSIVAVEWAAPAVSAAAIFGHTLLQITAVLVRSSVRVAAWGSFVALADRRSQRPQDRVPAPVPAGLPEEAPSSDLVGDAELI